MFNVKWSIPIAIVVVTGCSPSGPPLATVTGEVKLNGQPLPHARVVFQPKKGKQASPSSGQTDKTGSFSLTFNRDRAGAMLGQHRVRVTTARVESTPSGYEVEIPEQLPPRYNANSELQYTVEPGSNHFEISLEAQAGTVGVTNAAAGAAPSVPNPCR